MTQKSSQSHKGPIKMRRHPPSVLRWMWYLVLATTILGLCAYWFGGQSDLPDSHFIAIIAFVPFVVISSALGMVVILQLFSTERDPVIAAEPAEIDLNNRAEEVGQFIEEMVNQGGEGRVKEFFGEQQKKLRRQGFYVRSEVDGPRRKVHIPSNLFEPSAANTEAYLDVARFCAAAPSLGEQCLVVCMPAIGDAAADAAKSFLKLIREVLEKIRGVFKTLLDWFFDVPSDDVEKYGPLEPLGLRKRTEQPHPGGRVSLAGSA